MNTQRGFPLRRNSGFTLIELLIVIAIIGILAVAVVLAVNPGRQASQANNATRQTHVEELAKAVSQYTLANNGTVPAGIDATNRVLGTCAVGATCTAVTPAAACLDLSAALVPTYLPAIPRDPRSGTAADTNYYVVLGAGNRVTAGACEPELGATITSTL